MGVTKQIGDRLGDVGAHQPVVAAMADAYMLQAIEVAQKRHACDRTASPR